MLCTNQDCDTVLPFTGGQICADCMVSIKRSGWHTYKPKDMEEMIAVVSDRKRSPSPSWETGALVKKDKPDQLEKLVDQKAPLVTQSLSFDGPSGAIARRTVFINYTAAEKTEEEEVMPGVAAEEEVIPGFDN